jgi:uncharacterized membrane protein
MGRIVVAVGILFGIVIVIGISPDTIATLVTNTSTAGNRIFIYLVPVTIVISGITAVFVALFRPKKKI